MATSPSTQQVKDATIISYEIKETHQLLVDDCIESDYTLKKIGDLLNPQKRFCLYKKVSKHVLSSKNTIKNSTKLLGFRIKLHMNIRV
jgi:hypoxanthine-guanine phosphoribosyltransferase